MECRQIFAQWRNWIRPLVIGIYVVILVIALPLLILELNLNGAKAHTQAWLIGGIFVVLAIPISMWGILQHMIHYTQPHLQRHIIRVLWMVPIYAMDAWLALRFKDAAIYLDTLRECYEAYVVYNFMAYLLTFLNSEYSDLEGELELKPQVRHLFPLCCLPPWKMGRPLIQHCRHGVLQYTVIRPLTTCIALICQKLHVYNEGDFNFKSAWSYLAIINNISQVGAMYCLVLFYVATKEQLAPIKPVGKFLCIKAVVFMTFWQSVLIAALVKVGVIRADNTWGFDSVEEVATGLQDFIICIEMFFAAIAHYFSFSHKPFVEEGGTQADCCVSFAAMWDVSDVRADVVDHVRHVGKSVRRTLRRNPSSQNERTPLLQDGGSMHSHTSLPNITDFAGEDYTRSRHGSIGTVTSLDASVSDMPQSRSFTASMNNYMDLSETADGDPTDPAKVDLVKPATEKTFEVKTEAEVTATLVDISMGESQPAKIDPPAADGGGDCLLDKQKAAENLTEGSSKDDIQPCTPIPGASALEADSGNSDNTQQVETIKYVESNNGQHEESRNVENC